MRSRPPEHRTPGRSPHRVRPCSSTSPPSVNSARPAATTPTSTYTLTGPDGEVFDEFLFSCNSDQGPIELPAGTYTLTIDGRDDATGYYQITSWDVPAPDTSMFAIGDVISGEIETPGVLDVQSFTTPGQTVFFDVTALGELGETGCNNANFDLHPHRTRRRGVRPNSSSPATATKDPSNSPPAPTPSPSTAAATPPATTRSPLRTCRRWIRSPSRSERRSTVRSRPPASPDTWTFTTPGQTVFFDVTAIGELGETGCNDANFDLHPHRPRRRRCSTEFLSQLQQRPRTRRTPRRHLHPHHRRPRQLHRLLPDHQPRTSPHPTPTPSPSATSSPARSKPPASPTTGPSPHRARPCSSTSPPSVNSARPAATTPTSTTPSPDPTAKCSTEFLFSCNSDQGPVELPAGTYTLTIDGRGNSTGYYQITTLERPRTRHRHLHHR